MGGKFPTCARACDNPYLRPTRVVQPVTFPTAEKFRDDFKLIISNCNLYNPPKTLIHQAGVELKKLFEEKWKGLPPLRAESEDDEGNDDSETNEEQSHACMSFALLCFILLICFPVTIAAMESQIETMHNSISALKNQKEKKLKKSKKKDAFALTPVTASKAAKKETKPTEKKKSAPKKTQISDDNVLSFEQKKDLSEAIQTLDRQKQVISWLCASVKPPTGKGH
jgi:hypothetical protein